MIDYKRYILPVLGLLFPLIVMAQDVKMAEEVTDSLPETLKLPTKKLKAYGLDAAKQGDPYSAIDFLSRYMDKKPEDMKTAYQLAHNYRISRDYEMSEFWYDKVYNENPGKYTLALYYLAEAQKSRGKYQQAYHNLKTFRKEYKGQKNADLFRKLAKISMDGCAIAPSIIDSPANANFIHLSTDINKAHVEFSPGYLNDSMMYYASLQLDKVTFYKKDDSTSQLPVRKFYTAKKTNKSWKYEGELNGPMNDPTMEVGNGAFSPDRKRFYYSKCGLDWRGAMICAIYMVSVDSTGKWGEPEMLPENVNNPNFSNSQPTVGTESKRGYEVVYFVSDRGDEGRGGKDIWYTIYDGRKKRWKDAKNAGGKMNTKGDEMTPYFDMKTRSMYFSSNGWIGIGGLDIFKTVGEVRKWSKPPINLGMPFNSGADDLYYTWHANHKEGFLVSNRKGGVALKNPTCCDDIYQFEFLNYIHKVVNGVVLNHDSTEAIPNADVQLFIVDTTTGENMLVETKKSDSKGDFQFTLEKGYDYRLTVGKEGYFTKDFETSTVGLQTVDTISTLFDLDTISKKAIKLDNIYFEFNSHKLTADSRSVIDSSLYPTLKNNPLLIIEISTHTDSKGSDSYNKKLSERRANSIVKHLISLGIEKDRLKGVGYGESQPIAPNTNPDGSDNPEGRAKNRRSEFKVLGKKEITYDDDFDNEDYDDEDE